jgi:hypothetical protein
VFEEDHSASPEKKASSVVLLAAGGVLVATVFATLASVLAAGSKPEASPPAPKAEVDQTVSTSTSFSVAPDGKTATVVITVSGKPKSEPEQARNAAAPADSPQSTVELTGSPTPHDRPDTTSKPTEPPSSSSSSSSPSSSSVPPSSSSVPSTSSTPKP